MAVLICFFVLFEDFPKQTVLSSSDFVVAPVKYDTHPHVIRKGKTVMITAHTRQLPFTGRLIHTR